MTSTLRQKENLMFPKVDYKGQKWMGIRSKIRGWYLLP